MTVVVVGSHPGSNPSMLRYTRLLADGYSSTGRAVTILRPTDRLSRSTPKTLRKWSRYLEQLAFLPVLAARSRNRIVHLADHSDAVYLALLPRLRSIVTCHDLIAVRAARGELPEHVPGPSGRAYQALVRIGMRRASLVASVSRTTAADVERLIGTASPVLPNPISPSISTSYPNAVRSARHRPYMLVVSTVGWRKRRWQALNVWLKLREVMPSKPDLVIVGPPLDEREQQLIARQPKSVHAAIQAQSGLSDADLASLYKNAVCLIQMSKYEGFAWPIIEANLFGTIAVCADEPILRETGLGNIFVPGDSLDSLSDSEWCEIVEVAQSGSRSDELSARAKSFDAASFSTALDRCYESLAAK
jgi:glycosyltransferase involved in cell wall biosynthesis